MCAIVWILAVLVETKGSLFSVICTITTMLLSMVFACQMRRSKTCYSGV